MNRPSLSPVRPARSVALLLASTLAAGIFAGCGSVGNTSSSRLRAVNASTNSGTADLLVNSSASYGDSTGFSVSQYYYVATGTSVFDALTSVTSASSSIVTARSNSYNLSSGQFYTAYLIGRGDVTTISDPRDLEVLVANDTTPSLGSGQAAVRVIDAAPDAGAVDVLANGKALAPSFTDIAFTVTRDNVFAASYVPVTAGTLSVQVNSAGTSTNIIPATSVTVQAGHAYTLLVTEPVGGTAPLGVTGGTSPTYALQTTTE